MTSILPESLQNRVARRDRSEPTQDGLAAKQADVGRGDWSAWPAYDAADTGFRNYWYPVQWSGQLTDKPQQVKVCGETLVLIRDAGVAYALHDRCPHRGVPLSEGRQEFPGTITCPYHGWTYDLTDGVLKAVITDGPDSPICGKVAVRTYPVEERLGLVWVFIGDRDPHPIDDQLPEELSGATYSYGGRITDRTGNWRLACENGYDEGHAKYLHRTSLWRIFKVMPTWNKTHLERRGRWLFRVQDEVHWHAEFPGLGRWTNDRWYKIKPPAMKAGTVSNIGNTGGAAQIDPHIAAQEFPGFVSRRAARRAAGRLPPVHPLRVLRPHRRGQPPLRRRDGPVQGGAGRGLVPRPLPERDPLAVPRQLLEPGCVDGRAHRLPTRTALPPRPVPHRLAPPRRGTQPIRA